MKKLSSYIKKICLKLMNNKSYRKKYTYYYALTFVIPIIVILLTNVAMHQVVKTQILRSNEQIFKQFFQLVDERIAFMVDDAYEIVLSQELQEYARLSETECIENSEKRISAIALLNSYYSQEGVYEDIFSWFLNSDSLLSGVKPIAISGKPEEYCNIYYPKELQMLQRLEQVTQQGVVHAVFWPIQKEEGKQYFALSLNRFRMSEKLHNYGITLVIDSEFMETFIGEGVFGKGENVMLFNSDGEGLFSYQKDGMKTLPQSCRASGIYERKENGKAYTLLVQESKSTNGYYAMEVSHDVFFEFFSRIRIISYIGILLSAFVGMIIAKKMSRSTYYPLEQVLSQFRNNMRQQFDPGKHNEFEYMTEMLKRKEREDSANKQITQKNKEDERRKELLMVALEGNAMSEKEMNFLNTKVSLNDHFWGGILQLKCCGKVGWDLISFVIANVLEEIFQNISSCDIVSVSASRHIIVLGMANGETEEELEELLCKGIEFLKKYFDIQAIIGMGERCSGLYGLNKLYQQAQRALGYHFILENQMIIRYHDIQERQFKLPSFDQNSIFHIVDEYLQKGEDQKEIVEVFVGRLKGFYNIDKETSIETVEYFRYEMLTILNRTWAGNEVEYFRRQNYVEQLMEVESIGEYLHRLVDVFCDMGRNMQDNSHRTGLTRKIKAYVDENYSNSDMSVAMIGEVFDMQAAYLSQMFRDEYGVLLLNYITSVRVKAAKAMLRESKMTIKEIAENTGFLSSGVFIKTFKKNVGLTPGKYREIKNNYEK